MQVYADWPLVFTLLLPLCVASIEEMTYAGSDSACMSSDARFIVTCVDARHLTAAGGPNSDLVWYDRLRGVVRPIRPAPANSQILGQSRYPSVTNDGSVVVFASTRSDLVTKDDNNCTDVFGWWATSGEVRRLSVSANGVAGRRASTRPTISADQNSSVVFVSDCSSLCDGDSNGESDAFVHALVPGTTMCVTSHPGTLVKESGHAYGVSNAAISADGLVIAVTANVASLVDDDTNGMFDVYVMSAGGAAIERISIDDAGSQFLGDSTFAGMSKDGNRIAFVVHEPYLDQGRRSMRYRIGVRDRAAQATFMVSDALPIHVEDMHELSAMLDPTGHYLVLEGSRAGNATDIELFVVDLDARDCQRLDLGAFQPQSTCSIQSVSSKAEWVLVRAGRLASTNSLEPLLLINSSTARVIDLDREILETFKGVR